MPRLKPFRAYIPDIKYVKEIICPPYDVIDTQEARDLARKKGPRSFLRVIRSEIDFPINANPYSEEIYRKAKENLDRLILDHSFVQEKFSVFYIYQLTWKNRSQAGIVGLTHIEDYLNQKIKKHEFTRPEKEEDRFRHIDILGFNCEPVFFAFQSQDSPSLEKEIQNIVQKEDNVIFDIEDEDSVRHQIFKIQDLETIRKIQSDFEKLPAIYIADGHHRTASTVKAGLKRKNQDPNYNPNKSYNWFLSVTFPSNQLNILPYNRVVKDLNSLSKEEFLSQIQKRFEIQNHYSSSLKIHEFLLFLEHQWYHLRLKKEFYRKGIVENLDVSYLQDYILSPILNISDPRTSDRIAFIGGIKGNSELEKLVLSGKWKLAFSLHPTPIDDLFAVADANQVMPPKSTWFEPKLKSGFFLYKIDES